MCECLVGGWVKGVGASCEASTDGSCCTGVWGGRDGFAGVHPLPALSPMLHHNPEMMI